MASNFTSLWTAAFSWLGSLFTLPLPIYFGGVALSTLDIIVGTFGILVAFAFIRSLLKSTFSLAGSEIKGSINDSKMEQRQVDSAAYRQSEEYRAKVNQSMTKQGLHRYERHNDD